MRLKFQLAVAIGCAGFLALSLPAFGHPSSRDDNNAQHAHTATQPQPQPRPRGQRATYRVPAYVERLVEASKPAMGWPALVSEARKYLGTNPTKRRRLWCATFMNFVLHKVGYSGTNSDAARSFAQYGERIAKPEVGAIAVLTRGKRGGHVGVVSGVDAHGNPVIISGNHNKRVGESVYPRSRVIAYVKPTHRQAHKRRVNRSAAHIPPPDRPLTSPFAELITAIKAERTQAQARAPRRAAPRRQAEMPSRVVRQMPN
jgi:uncharacterized protein (TIGR02594 family)